MRQSARKSLQNFGWAPIHSTLRAQQLSPKVTWPKGCSKSQRQQKSCKKYRDGSECERERKKLCLAARRCHSTTLRVIQVILCDPNGQKVGREVRTASAAPCSCTSVAAHFRPAVINLCQRCRAVVNLSGHGFCCRSHSRAVPLPFPFTTFACHFVAATAAGPRGVCAICTHALRIRPVLDNFFICIFFLRFLSFSLSLFSLIEKCHIVRKSTLNRDGAHPPLIAHYNIPISCTSIGQLHLHLSHIPMDNYIICKHSPRPTPNMLKPHNSSSCFSECPQFIVYYYLPFVCCYFSFCFYCYYSLFFCWRCKINYLACALIVRAIKQTRHNAVN